MRHGLLLRAAQYMFLQLGVTAIGGPRRRFGIVEHFILGACTSGITVFRPNHYPAIDCAGVRFVVIAYWSPLLTLKGIFL